MAGLQLIAAYDSEVDEEIDEEITEVVVPQDTPRIEETEEMVHQDVLLVLSTLLNQVVDMTTSKDPFRGQFCTTKNDCEIDLTDDSSSSWSLKSDTESSIDDEVIPRLPRPAQPYKGPKTKGELDLEDLPLLEDLRIKCSTDELTHIGRVASIIDRVIIVQSFKSQYPLDLDTVLFNKDGHALGSIFDVFGPVCEPRYVVRFNDHEDIIKKNISVDSPVYYAASLHEPYTSYIFTSHLLAMKGSDASWKHNHEPPEEVKEYSDDEEEGKARNATKKRKMPHNNRHSNQL